MKKKILIMICVLLTTAAIIVGGFHFYSAQKEAEYVTTAVPYLKQVIPELSKWDPALTKGYMSKEFMKKVSPERYAQTLKALARVGELQSLEEPKFEEVFSDKDQIVVSYTVQAHYSTGPAEITMGLIDSNGSFSVYRFNIRSEALQQK